MSKFRKKYRNAKVKATLYPEKIRDTLRVRPKVSGTGLLESSST